MDRWSNLMKVLTAAAPEAHIAGGALRDLLNKRPIKDVDVFISSENNTSAVNALFDAFDVHMTKSITEEYFDHDARVYEASEFEVDGLEHPLNLVSLHDHFSVEENLKRFDFGICQVALVKDNLIRTDAFQRDQQDQTFTMVRCENKHQYARSMERFERLQEKYEGWTLIVPETFVKFKPEDLEF